MKRMIKGGTSEKSFSTYLDATILIPDNLGVLRHLGDYYTTVTGQSWRRQDGTGRKGYVDWLKQYYYNPETALPFELWLKNYCEERKKKFTIYSDWRGEGFIYRVEATRNV